MMTNDSCIDGDDDFRPDWADRADHIDHKPDWVDFIPHELWELGEVFFPIPNGRKAWSYPHHLDEARYTADDEILNAYFETGFNYGIACAENLAVVDVDEPEYIEHIKASLPDTVWQVSGSRTGEHIFFKCEGLRTRINLRMPKPEDHIAAEGIERIENTKYRHVGEVKCDPHGYVVGPRSRHPSGNQYGPLKGESITSISEDELREALNPYINYASSGVRTIQPKRKDRDVEVESKYEFYNLEPNDVVSWLEPGKRVSHPAHGSSTGTNFMRVEGEPLFMCWRHSYGGGEGCALNPQHLLAVMATGKPCDEVRHQWNNSPELHYQAWMEAVDRGLVSYKSVPYRVARGFAINRRYIDKTDDLVGDMYWDAVNAIKITVEEKYLPDQPPL